VRSSPRLGGVAAIVVAVIACGSCGGQAHASGSGTLTLPGGTPVSAHDISVAASEMCTVASQTHTNPSGVLRAFYAGPHDSLHLLAAVASAKNAAQAQNLLDVMVAYEGAIAATPPPPETARDADSLVQAVDATLKVVGITPPSC